MPTLTEMFVATDLGVTRYGPFPRSPSRRHPPLLPSNRSSAAPGQQAGSVHKCNGWASRRNETGTIGRETANRLNKLKSKLKSKLSKLA